MVYGISSLHSIISWHIGIMTYLEMCTAVQLPLIKIVIDPCAVMRKFNEVKAKNTMHNQLVMKGLLV